MPSLCAERIIFISFLKGAGARVNVVRSKWTSKSDMFFTSKWKPLRSPWRRESSSGLSEKHILSLLYVHLESPKFTTRGPSADLRSAQALIFKGFGAQLKKVTYFYRFGEGKFLEVQDDVPFPDLKLDTFPVPLEARIALWLEREEHSQFPECRLEIYKIYHLRTRSRPCKVLTPLFVNGL